MNKNELDWLLQRFVEVYQSEHPKENTTSIYVVGSQSVFEKYKPPSEILRYSQELDVIPEKYSDELDSNFEFVLGEDSPHEEEYGTALDIVEEITIKTPKNWKDRCIVDECCINGFLLKINYLDPHDLVFCDILPALKDGASCFASTTIGLRN